MYDLDVGKQQLNFDIKKETIRRAIESVNSQIIDQIMTFKKYVKPN